MQTVTSSEFCRIVKKVSKESKEKLSLGHMGENYGTCEETGKAARKNLSVYGKRYVWKVWFGTGETLPITER